MRQNKVKTCSTKSQCLKVTQKSNFSKFVSCAALSYSKFIAFCFDLSIADFYQNSPRSGMFFICPQIRVTRGVYPQT